MYMSKEERNNQPSKPYALCVTEHYNSIQIWTINAYEVDELTASINGGEIKKFKIRTEQNNGGEIDTDYERQYFTINGRKVYLDECVRYGTPWLASL